MTEILTLVNIKNQNAAPICKVLELNEEARVLIRNSTRSAQYLQELLKKELYDDALNFFAHALNKREAVWWGCKCISHTLTEKASSLEIHALEVSKQWVQCPSEENRKHTMPAAVATAFKSAASWAAVAAFWSNDYAIQTKSGTVRDDFTAKAIINAVKISAIDEDLDVTRNNYTVFFQYGIQIASHGIETQTGSF
jgi:hypothetical protein